MCDSGAWARSLGPTTPSVLILGASAPGPWSLASLKSDSALPTPPPQIREEIDKFGIHVYQFPECDSDEDEDFKQQDRELKVSGLGWQRRELEVSLHGAKLPGPTPWGQESCLDI